MVQKSVKVCSSCNKQVIDDYVEFNCPKCLKEKMVRCKHCRVTVKKYKCPGCGFQGP